MMWVTEKSVLVTQKQQHFKDKLKTNDFYCLFLISRIKSDVQTVYRTKTSLYEDSAKFQFLFLFFF